MEKERYQRNLLYTLAGFQLIELFLKNYIGVAYDIIKIKLDGVLPFNYNREDVEGFPLEKLLNTFSKITGDKQLIRELGQLKEYRNLLAHQALIALYDPHKSQDEYQKLNDALTQVADDVKNHVDLVHNKLIELQKTLENLQ